MKNKVKPLTRNIITGRTILYQLIGYGILFFLIIGDEIFDFPHIIFEFQAIPINWVETLIECIYVIILCILSIFVSWKFLKEIKFLEGFLPICSCCKKIRDGNEWKPIEKYMMEHSEAFFIHSLCQECLKKHYPEFIE